MFLIGGPPYCGTTLLTLMLNQPGVTCLNEPDFHDPEQSHNGLPVLERRYPEHDFPRRGEEELSFREAFELMRECQKIIEPDELGFKFCSLPFIELSRLFRSAGLPVVAIVRDIRDALVRPLLPYIDGEAGLASQYRQVWQNRTLFSAIVRYEDLVFRRNAVLETLSSALALGLIDRCRWNPDDVPSSMLYPEDRHAALKDGFVRTDRVGIWRECGKAFTRETHELATEMGYPGL